MIIYSKELGRMLLLGVAENRFSEENLDYLHVWAPEINLKCLAAIDFGREILFQQNSNILLNCSPHVLILDGIAVSCCSL